LRLAALAGLVLFVCLSVIFGTFVIIRFVIFVLPSSLVSFRIITDISRVLLAVALGCAWLRGWKMITDHYFWRSINASPRDRDET